MASTEVEFAITVDGNIVEAVIVTCLLIGIRLSIVGSRNFRPWHCALTRVPNWSKVRLTNCRQASKDSVSSSCNSDFDRKAFILYFGLIRLFFSMCIVYGSSWFRNHPMRSLRKFFEGKFV